MIVYRTEDGTRIVADPDDEIWVDATLLTSADLDPDFIEPDGTLRLDSAGEYRYRYHRPSSATVDVYRRVIEP